MLITGHVITSWQRCKRRFILESNYRYMLWHPNVLFSSVIRKAILSLSSGADKYLITPQAVNTFMSGARQPGFMGMEGINTYILASDYVACIKNIIEYLSRIALLPLTDPKPIPLSTAAQWKPLCHMDESGTLHRWQFVDYISSSTITTILHSWELFGDLALLSRPMILHLVSIGRRNNSHHDSPWSKAYSSPGIANYYRFQKKSGNDLPETWKAMYYADSAESDSETWIDRMIEDEAHLNLIQHLNISEPQFQHRSAAADDIRYELATIRQVLTSKLPWHALPMSRGACDKPSPCPHQELCYSPNAEESLNNSALYETIKP